jgi:hypothetical protein
MSAHAAISAEEVGDRLAIRELVDAWAHYADRRLPRQQAELFVPDGTVAVYTSDTGTSEDVQQIQGHDALAESFLVLNNYEYTTHFNGQSTITLDGASATGESYCLAHHVWVQDGQRQLMVMAIRYLDTFTKTDGVWRFASRILIIDRSDQRPSRA